MKIFRPERYYKTIRITFSKKTDGKLVKRATTIVETNKRELDSLIKKVFREELQRGEEKAFDFVKMTVQVIMYYPGAPRKKDEWSYRLYRTSVDAVEKLEKAVDDLQI